MGLFDRLWNAMNGGGASADEKEDGGDAGVDSSDDGGARDDRPDSERDGSPGDGAAILVDEAADVGYDLDYSPASLVTLDELLEDLSAEGRDAFGRHVVAYLGEVFVRNYEGEWTFVEDEGWLVDLDAVSNRDGELLALPYAVHAVMEGETTLAAVHDDTVGSLSVDGPRLADGAAGAGDEPLPDESRSGQRDRAAELVDHWPEYDLDYSPASLAALDDLVADNYDASPNDVDRAERLSASPPGTLPEGATVRIGSGGEAARIAAYVGEVFCRTYRAVWVGDEATELLVVETASGNVELQPKMLVSGAFQGYVSFERLHDALADDHGLTATS